jgi:hypothetical protein
MYIHHFGVILYSEHAFRSPPVTDDACIYSRRKCRKGRKVLYPFEYSSLTKRLLLRSQMISFPLRRYLYVPQNPVEPLRTTGDRT